MSLPPEENCFSSFSDGRGDFWFLGVESLGELPQWLERVGQRTQGYNQGTLCPSPSSRDLVSDHVDGVRVSRRVPASSAHVLTPDLPPRDTGPRPPSPSHEVHHPCRARPRPSRCESTRVPLCLARKGNLIRHFPSFCLTPGPSLSLGRSQRDVHSPSGSTVESSEPRVPGTEDSDWGPVCLDPSLSSPCPVPVTLLCSSVVVYAFPVPHGRRRVPKTDPLHPQGGPGRGTFAFRAVTSISLRQPRRLDQTPGVPRPEYDVSVPPVPSPTSPVLVTGVRLRLGHLSAGVVSG